MFAASVYLNSSRYTEPPKPVKTTVEATVISSHMSPAISYGISLSDYNNGITSYLHSSTEIINATYNGQYYLEHRSRSIVTALMIYPWSSLYEGGSKIKIEI